LDAPDWEDSKVDEYTLAIIVLAIVVLAAFGYIMLGPEKS
jgi:hypothetical protein